MDHLPIAHTIHLTPELRVGWVSSFPPTRCGIARFSSSLIDALETVAPAMEVDVVRLVGALQPEFDDRSALTVQPDLPIGIRAAARRLNGCDVVVFQHEYGLYGRNDGEAVLDLVERIHRPKVAVLHTVLAEPSREQRRIIEELDATCQLVVLSESARTALERDYSIPRTRVEVIAHGTSWLPAPPNPGPRRTMITWGLLGPGKGLERAIAALPELSDLDPLPRLRIVGRTHPNVLRMDGPSYRNALVDLATRLGVADMVEFVDSYLDDQELYREVRESDVVVLPYDNHEQISSGVLIEAIAAGRPVVATNFPHAVELLESGAGTIVEHDTSALAGALRTMLTDEGSYLRSARKAAASSFRHSWQETAAQYTRLLAELVAESDLPLGQAPETS